MKTKPEYVPNLEELMKAATEVVSDKIKDAKARAEKEQEIIDTFNSSDAQRMLKKAPILSYLNINRAYLQTRYGKYAVAGVVFAATATYVAALFLAPTLIPFGLAAITTAWLKWTLAAIFSATALYSGYLFLTKTANEFMALMTRAMNTFKNEDDLEAGARRLSNHDVALLATLSVAGAGVVGLLYAMPSLLPALSSMGSMAKIATAVVSGTVSLVAGGAALKGFFANRAAAAEQAKAKDLELTSKKETQGESQEDLDEDSYNRFATKVMPK